MTFHSMDTLDIGVIINLSRYPAYQKFERVEEHSLAYAQFSTFFFYSSLNFVHKQDGTLHALKLFKLHLNSEVKICNISKEYYHN